MYQIVSYIKFLLTSTNQHGVHSPFIYNLVTKCFYDKTFYNDYSNIIAYKNNLKNNDSLLEISDFGSGSKKTFSSTRKISDIAKHVSTKTSRAKLLFRITTYFKPTNILELGTSLGVATHAMALCHTKPKIKTIEGCPELYNFTNNQLHAKSHITCINGQFNDVIPKLEDSTFDIIFFDGHHNKEATIKYFEMLLAKATNDSVFIFDDIYWSKEMTDAWNNIKSHPKVTVSIDTFFWGFIFLDKSKLNNILKLDCNKC